jgi:hypothetical protein
MFGASKPPRFQGEEFGQEVVDRKVNPPTEVQGPEAQPVCAVRPAQGVHAKVWDVQDLLQAACPGG